MFTTEINVCVTYGDNLQKSVQLRQKFDYMSYIYLIVSIAPADADVIIYVLIIKEEDNEYTKTGVSETTI